MPAPRRPAARRWSLLAGLLLVVALFAAWSEAVRPVRGPHSRLELALMGEDGRTREGRFFATSELCAGCHGHDPRGVASVDAQGRDVNVADDWSATMMAHSARDPFFRAKMAHERLENPGQGEAIEAKCLGCHAPMGAHEQRMLGGPPFTAAMLDTSRLGLDGVGCLACHMQSEALAGSTFSGELEFDAERVYGPYADDQIDPAIMEFFVGWRPGFGEHLVNSRNCAGCHTLVTATLGTDGQPTGDRFVEQATYHEWLNSVYSANGTQCNTCHMPRITDPILLAADYPFLNRQSPFGLHHLVGGNTHMLELMKANRTALGITVAEARFDSAIARTRRMLGQRTLGARLVLDHRDADTAYYALRLENRAGHKFPSGYPSRRAFVTFIVLDAGGDTVFKSGTLRGDLELEHHGTPYEPHHDVIRSPERTQVYELVMGDAQGVVTTVLMRAKEPLKDNRLPPAGFTSTHPAYDTVRVVGVPASDTDFNRNTLGEEGGGGDVVRYHVPLNGHAGTLRAFAMVYFQPVPPGWNTELFTHASPEIGAFRAMLSTSDGRPVQVAADSIVTGPLGMPEDPRDRVVLFPNPTMDGRIAINLAGGLVELVAVYDASGRRTASRTQRCAHGWWVRLPNTPGVYMLHLRVDGVDVLKRVVRR